MMNWI